MQKIREISNIDKKSKYNFILPRKAIFNVDVGFFSIFVAIFLTKFTFFGWITDRTVKRNKQFENLLAINADIIENLIKIKTLLQKKTKFGGVKFSFWILLSIFDTNS